MLERANGGTKHTMQTIPVWDGLWGSGNNTMPAIFLENGTLANAWRPGATKIKEGVLTPPYEQHFRERRAEIDQYGEQRYDRLTNCEYPGVPRWLWEPYIKEFVNMPHSVVAHERHDERDAARLYRQRARQHREQALAARRQHRFLGRRQADDLDEVGEPGRLRARHAADEQSVRDGRDVGKSGAAATSASSSRKSRSTIRSCS